MLANHAGSTASQAGAEAVPVFVVSANPVLRRELGVRLQSPRWAVTECCSGAECLERLDASAPKLIVLDPVLPDIQAADLRALIQLQMPTTEVLSVNSHTGQPLPTSGCANRSAARVIEALGTGIGLESSVNEVAESADTSASGLPGMVGESLPMQRVYRMARLVAPRDTTVLITGESGSGKDLVARAIHDLSTRRSQPFVVINCAAIPESLLEAELFGYAKGSFTGAVQSRVGRINAANGGTLFLDEIGELPVHLQSKLLRFLEQGEIQRLGTTETYHVDVRVIAATNVPIRALVEERKFREDLYYRLSVFPIALPSLRDRPGDLSNLVRVFVRKFGLGRLSVSPEAQVLLEQHEWPGNVRELRNVIERAAIMLDRGFVITPEHIIF